MEWKESHAWSAYSSGAGVGIRAGQGELGDSLVSRPGGGGGMNRSARAIAAFVIVVLALTADVWLIRRPEPHSVAEFSPFTTALGREELILKGPMSPAGPLLSHQGGKNEVVDIFFEKGILSDPTRKLLGTSPIAKSAAPQLISYTTLDSPPTGG